MAHQSQPVRVVMAEGTLPSFLPLPDADRSHPFREPANENLKVKSEWMTPAEALQAIQRIKRRLQRENAKTQSLLKSGSRRRIWDEVQACEQCLRWMYFRASGK